MVISITSLFRYFNFFLLWYLFILLILLQATGTVTVNVDNENDHAPSCQQSTKIISVLENAGKFKIIALCIYLLLAHIYIS